MSISQKAHAVLRVVSRAALIAAVVLVSQGTSCVGPSVFVVQRFSLTSGPDTSFSFPERVRLPLANYSLPEPKRRWWSKDPARPLCRGFHLYTADWPPTNVPRGDPAIGPPYTFEVRLAAQPEPTLIMWYRCHLPLNLSDSTTPEGAAQRARIAKLDTIFRQNADSLARAILVASGAEPVVPAADVRRMRSWKEVERWCRAGGEEPSAVPLRLERGELHRQRLPAGSWMLATSTARSAALQVNPLRQAATIYPDL